MKGFEFLRNITIGQYLPTGSALHGLHPGTRLAVAVLLLIVLLIPRSVSALVLALVFIIAALRVGRIPLRYAIRGIRPAIPVIVLVMALQVLLVERSDAGRVFWAWWIIRITAGDFAAAATGALRIIDLILVITLFTFCTSTTELTHGTESLLRPLMRVGFPAHEVSLVVTIALRFLPILSAEAEYLVAAQASRGADFGRGRMPLFRRLFRMMPLLIPLFISSLRRGENLARAMEARCYTGGDGRTSLVRFGFGRPDLLSLVSTGLAGALILAVNYTDVDGMLWGVLTTTGG